MLSILPIYTNVDFPTTASPSLTCLQWSGDGQVFLTTKNSLHIMTPYHTTTVKAPPRNSKPHDKVLDWYRTTIEIDKKVVHNWTAVSEDWGAVVFGSLDIGLRAVALSPSNLAKDAGCLAALLSSNLDLSIWAPDRNRHEGKWTKIQDITLLLKELLSPKHPAGALPLRAQVTSITWSPQADFGLDPTPDLDASLLVVGTRGGTLIFLRFENGAIHHVNNIKVSNSWLTRLAFSPWARVEKGKCEARLAFGNSDGGVEIITIIQSLTSVQPSSVFGPTFSIRPQFQNQSQRVSEPDKRNPTALTWIVSKKNTILVTCKPGVVSLWAPSSPLNDFGWEGHRSLLLRTHDVSIGSSPLHPVSGVYHVPAEDRLIICLFDGSFHVIHNLSSNPSWTSVSPTNDMSGHELSEAARTAFDQTESENPKPTDVNRICGLIPFDGQATALWIHESCQPTDLSYKYDSRHNTKFVAARLWRCTGKDAFLRDLATTLNTAKATGDTPIHLLRPCFSYIHDHPEISTDIIKLLRCSPHISMAEIPFEDIPTSIDSLPGPQDLRLEFRKSLSRYLFGSSQALQLRMKLFTADRLLQVLPESLVRNECEQMACQLFHALSQILLRILICHLTPIATALTINDAPFVLRITDQSSFPGCPPGLIADAKRLANTIRSTVLAPSPQGNFEGNGMSEVCPACSAEIVLETGANAVCSNGHSWGRCSITSFILATGMVRRCVGCSRKAFLPLSFSIPAGAANWLPKQAQCWIVEELLEAVSRCPFCGNNFVCAL